MEALERAGAAVTFPAVAKAAGVSTWLARAEGVREHVEAARARQAQSGAVAALPAPAVEARATPASLRTDLAIARAQIKTLRSERDKLVARFRLHLGAEIEGPQRAELIARVAELEGVNRRLVADRDARVAEVNVAQRHLRELEDELTAARESLRQVIRAENRGR